MGKSIVIKVFTGIGRVFIGEVEQRCPQVQFVSLHGPVEMQVMGQVRVDPDIVRTGQCQHLAVGSRTVAGCPGPG